MRINTTGHMMFLSSEEAKRYALNAGFTVIGNEASRPDMTSTFTLQRVSKGRTVEFMWYRPYTSIQYS